MNKSYTFNLLEFFIFIKIKTKKMKVSPIINITPISLIFTIIYLKIAILIKRENCYIFFSYLSKITIKINSLGMQQIFSSDFNNFPDFIVINNLITNINSNILDLSDSSNIIEMTWNNDLTSCEKMFSKCYKIEEVDLSQFIGEAVTKYNNMFEDCFH